MSIKNLQQYISQEEFTAAELPEAGELNAAAGVDESALDADVTAELVGAEVEIPATDESITDEQVELADEEAYDAEIDMDADVERLDGAVEAVTEAEEEIASIEHYMTVLQHGLKTKSYSPQFAATSQLLLNKLNTVFGQAGTVSLESFATDDLEGYYTASLESYRGFVKRLWDVNDRINNFIPDLLQKGSLVNGFKKRAAALNARADKIQAAGAPAGDAKVSIAKAMGGRADIVAAATADLRLTTAVASKGLSANEAFIKSLAEVLVEATNDGGVNKTGAIVAKARNIAPAANSYPEEAFATGFLGGKKLTKEAVEAGYDSRTGIKALQKGGIPSVGSGTKASTGEATLKPADVSKLISLAKAYAALGARGAEQTGVAAFEQLKSIKGKVDRAHGGGFMNSAGRGTGAQATSWSEGKDLDTLASALPKLMQNHINVYRFINGHALAMADQLLSLAEKAQRSGKKAE